jgi:hypothetical protein
MEKKEACPTCGSKNGVPNMRAKNKFYGMLWHQLQWHRLNGNCLEAECQPCPTCSAKKEVSAMTEHVLGDLAATVENLQRIVSEKKEPCKLCGGSGWVHEPLEPGRMVRLSQDSFPCPNGCKPPGTNLWTPGMVGADPLANLEPKPPDSSIFAEVASELAANIGSGEQGVRTMTGILSRRFGPLVEAGKEVLEYGHNKNDLSWGRLRKALTDLEKRP